ncbi:MULTISPECIES: ATP-binding protein [Trichocoleus]|uniref:histidine kinase n=1 Tax=Trichocoleus desertorum GB2-A4 TaxID=2933944 RepID=A0ABV0JDL7_9CYAN|nr:ATP-binding protein [Trichocoleus sp. FACHB-46]MBD1861281.1 GAF domain-containing protein [Trichocoleus sp. FACHB-46]
MNNKCALKQSSCVALGSALLEFLTALPDLHLVLFSSQNPQVTPCQLGLELKTGAELSLLQPPATHPNSYFKFKPEGRSQPQSTWVSGEEGSNGWLACHLDLERLPTHLETRQSPSQTPLVFILGISDRFSILFQAGCSLPLEANRADLEPLYQIELIYDSSEISKFCAHLQPQTSTVAAIAPAFETAIASWVAQSNAPELQSEITLRLLMALEANGAKPQALTPTNHSMSPNSQAVAARPNTKTIYQQPHWLQQEKLLHELLHVSSSSLEPQTILRRSAEVIRTIFNVSRCLIAFYSAKDQRVIWGAIARSPELLTGDRHTHYPAWATVEQLIHKHHHLSTWVSDEFPLLAEHTEIRESGVARAALSSWTQSHPKHADKWVGGFLCIEQWERDRIWQPEEMYLLHMVIHQIEQVLYQALVYQQAEERVQRAALVNRLVAQIRASLDLSHIFETVVMELGQLVVVDCCSIFQYLEDPQDWQVQTEYRLQPEASSTVDATVFAPIHPHSARLRNLQTVQVSDARTLRPWHPEKPPSQVSGAWLMVPIHYHQKLWGCISFRQDHYPRYWHESEVELLTTVADQLAIAIHQATLYQQIQQHNQTLEAQVAQRTAELEYFFDALPDHIFVMHREGMTLSFCNHAFAKSIGYEDRQNIQGQSIFGCLPSNLLNHFAEQNLQVFQSGQTLHTQETIVFPSGMRHLDTFKVPLKKPDGEVYGLLGTSRDITELIETRQALSERTEQLQDALTAACKASQAKSEFLATMSHELRTPLTSVIGMSSALLNRLFGSLTPKQSEYLGIIHNSGTHLLQLINDILDLSKIEAGKASLQISRFSLQEVAEQSVASLSEKAHGQKLVLTTDLVGLQKCDRFVGDQRRVKQILLNLLSNAIKFTPVGGQVWLRLRCDGNIVTIEVEDTGIGIAADKHHLLFEAFQQIDSALNRKHEGTGLGLALTRQLVEMHDGSISFKSQVGVGTVFTVHLQAQLPKGEVSWPPTSKPTEV